MRRFFSNTGLWFDRSNIKPYFKVKMMSCSKMKGTFTFYNFSGNSCWASSHGGCEKKQTIDLSFVGFDPAYMDEQQPVIVVSEWYIYCINLKYT